jgi:hypothetical protein
MSKPVISPGSRPRGPALVRWASKVRKMPDGCWQWIGATDSKGYGRFGRGGRAGGVAIVHRWTYEQFVGPIPTGLTIDHLCRNTSCVNPDHMEPVTRAENVRRANLANAEATA